MADADSSNSVRFMKCPRSVCWSECPPRQARYRQRKTTPTFRLRPAGCWGAETAPSDLPSAGRTRCAAPQQRRPRQPMPHDHEYEGLDRIAADTRNPPWNHPDMDATHPTRQPKKGAELGNPTHKGSNGGRYWDRTSDLCRVKARKRVATTSLLAVIPCAARVSEPIAFHCFALFCTLLPTFCLLWRFAQPDPHPDPLAEHGI